MYLAKVYALALVLVVAGCTSQKIHKNVEVSVASRIHRSFPGFRVMDVMDLDDDTRLHFKEHVQQSSPGLVCGYFKTKESLACGALLVNPSAQKDGAQMLVLMDVDSSEKDALEILEDYREWKTPRTHAFLKPQKQEVLMNKGKGPRLVPMLSDGFVREFYGQSAVVYFWDARQIQPVWIAD